MNWQLTIVALIVAAAAWYLFRKTWATWISKRSSCGGGCGCGKAGNPPSAANGTPTLISPEQITLRQRTDNPPAA